MEKLPICRICLVQDVRMYVVVNRNLHKLYEKLTEIPFVTEDRRPILACFVCCTKLKQSYQLLRKCLDSEEQLVEMMNEDYEPNLFIDEDCLDSYCGFVKSPIMHISIVDECQTESNNITVKQELPAVCEGLDEFIEPMEEHQSDGYKIMKHLLNHPEDLEKVKECVSTSKAKSSTYSPDLNLSEGASENRSDLYPSYYKIKQAKSKCYPGKEHMIINDEGAAIKLQALLNLTVSRLLDAIALDLDSATELLLISKWGFNGASGQSNYKQKTETEFDDSTIFMASLVPVRLQQCDGTIVWENDRPSSTFYCRPIMLKFTKETQSTVATIKASITQEIETLQPSRINQVEVKHQLHMTMIDGKITSYLSDTSSAVCDICKAKPSEMNNLESLAQLHIAYRLDFKKWSCRGNDKENK